MVAKDFEVDDLVWAKMKGFPAWPGKIARPSDKVKPPKALKPQHFVYFFGTKNFAWILDEHITPHSREMMENTKNYKKRPATLQRAIEEIEREGPATSGEEDKAASEEDTEEQPPEVEEPDESEQPSAEEREAEEEIVKTPVKSPKKSTPKSSPRKAGLVKRRPLPNISPSRGKKRKVVKKQALPPEFETSSSRNMELGATGGHYVSNTVPPKNGFSKVAVIPPYNERAAFSSGSRIFERHVYPRPPTPELDFTSSPKNRHQEKKVKATSKKIGFLGLGMMGRGIVKNLLATGHKVTVWNRTQDKCDPFVKAGATKATTPQDVVTECDIIFCCVSDPSVAKELVFGNCGVLAGLSDWSQGTKGYVEMTSVDPVTSQEIAEAVSQKGGRYLEAPLLGTREAAEDGQVLVLGAGDSGLFRDCESCFSAVAQTAFYLSCDVGAGAKMNLIMSMLAGTTLAAIAEAVTLMESCKLSTENFLAILEMGPFSHPFFMNKSRAMVNNQYSVGTALKHQQKDLTLALGIGQSAELPMPVTAAANEVYKRAKQLSYADHDSAAVHLGSKV